MGSNRHRLQDICFCKFSFRLQLGPLVSIARVRALLADPPSISKQQSLLQPLRETDPETPLKQNGVTEVAAVCTGLSRLETVWESDSHGGGLSMVFPESDICMLAFVRFKLDWPDCLHFLFIIFPFVHQENQNKLLGKLKADRSSLNRLLLRPCPHCGNLLIGVFVGLILKGLRNLC